MNAHSSSSRRLQIEALETRTLLAVDGTDPFGLETDFYTAMLAVGGTGAFQGSFSTNFGNQRLTLTGSENATLTIDLDTLPSFVTNLDISDFAAVNITGTDQLKVLELSGIGTFTAENLHVTASVTAADVKSLSLGSGGEMILLSGIQTKLDVESLRGTTIFSDLKSVTLASTSDEIYLISLNDKQDIYLQDHLPQLLVLSGLPKSSAHVLLPGASAPDITAIVDPGTEPPPTKPETPVDDGKLIIVSYPLDERTRTFLLELRAALHGADGSIDRLVADFVSDRKQTTDTGLLALNQVGRSTALDQLTSSLTTSKGTAAEEHLARQLVTSFSTGESLAAVQTGTDGQRFVDAPNVISAYNPSPAPVGAPMSVDVSWASQALSTEFGEDMGPDAKTRGDAEEELSLADSVRAFGSYVIERVTAEFSPGQQSFVLMVDPQPSRVPGQSRKSEADQAEEIAVLPTATFRQI